MSLSAKEAAEQVGLTRQGIMKAIHQGKISAQKDLNGQWQIEPVELFRVYQPVSCTQPDETSLQEVTPQGATEALERENELLWKMLADKDDVISDLRRRLDAEADERRKLSFILTDKQHEAKEPQKQGFWQRLFG